MESEMKDLGTMLREVDRLFKPAISSSFQTYLYTLGRFPFGWRFNVVDSWHEWIAAGLDFEFGITQTPEEAVQLFLDYVNEKNVSVAELMEGANGN